MEKKKLLVKTTSGQADKGTKEQFEAWNEALADLSPGQFDRYCRATKVWYDSISHSFDYEDK